MIARATLHQMDFFRVFVIDVLPPKLCPRTAQVRGIPVELCCPTIVAMKWMLRNAPDDNGFTNAPKNEQAYALGRLARMWTGDEVRITG
jgi:hypothetical protein